MKKIIFIIYLIFLSLASVFPSAEGLKLSISYFDKRIYYPESDIKIKVTISNQTSESLTFSAAEEYYYNFFLTVKNLKNQKLEFSEKYISKHNSSSTVFYRQITLMPGEEYSFIARLEDYTEIRNPGVYIVQAVFDTDFHSRGKDSRLYSNILTLPVRPSTSSPELKDMIDEETGEILQKIAMPPDQVVSYILAARQKNEWNKFFLYLDLESLMTEEPRLEAKYRSSSEAERMKLLEEYKKNLENNVIDNDILLVPTSFKILYTSYTPLKGKVVVEESFKYRTYTEMKEYTYFLHKMNGYWIIYNYEIRNTGTK